MKFKLVIDPSQEEQVTVVAHAPSELTRRIQELAQGEPEPDQILAYLEDEIRFLRFSDIACITVEQGKTYAIDANNQRYRLRRRLYELEAMLPASFLRINKSALANMDHLDRFASSYSGAVDAVFSCGYTEYVSRRCFAQIKRRFMEK